MKLTHFKKSDTLVSLFVDSEGLKNEILLNNCLYSIAKQTHQVDLVVMYNNLTQDEISLLEGYLKNPILTISKKEDDQTINEKIELVGEEKLNFHLTNGDAVNFSQIFNRGFNYATQNEYEFYSIIEQEDALHIKWYDYSSTYFKENSTISISLPLIRNVINGMFNGIIGEAAWVEGLAEEAGVLDINLLLRYNIVNILGAVFKVESVKENSEQKEDGFYYPFKESFRLTHIYEFFLRMIYNDLKVQTIPRIGYELKMVGKPYFSETSSKVPQNISVLAPNLGGVPQNEIQFYVDLAKKEYFFDKDRNVIFKS